MHLLKKLDGWWHGLYMACIAFPLYNVGAKIAIEQYQAHPLIFLCFGSLFSSLFLLLFAGKGNFAISSIKALDTWVFAFLNLAAVSFGVSLLVYVSALQGSILIRFASIVCFIITLIMGQSSSKKEYAFTFIAFLGIALLFTSIDLPTKEKAISLLLLLGASSCQALRQILSEFHKTNNLAKSTKDNARVAGMVSSISAFAFTLILLFFSSYQKIFNITIFSGIPELKDFFNQGTIICALIFAGVFSAISKYCEFYASKKISAKYLSSMVALMPLFVLIYEYIYSALFVDYNFPFSKLDLICLFLIIIGNLGVAISAILESKNNKETELMSKYIIVSSDEVKHARGLIESAMNFCNNSIEKTSKLLDINKNIIIDLLALDDLNNYKLSQNNFHLLNKNYYLNVSTKDSLTSIENRGSLEQKVKDLIYKNKKFYLCFIDLDKFKAINDIYGHDAGDAVLKHIAKLLNKVNKEGINGRNGGDEFIMITFKDPKEIIKSLNNLIKEDFIFKQHTLPLGISTGYSLREPNQNHSLDELIKIADEKMYKNKTIKNNKYSQ